MWLLGQPSANVKVPKMVEWIRHVHTESISMYGSYFICMTPPVAVGVVGVMQLSFPVRSKVPGSGDAAGDGTEAMLTELNSGSKAVDIFWMGDDSNWEITWCSLAMVLMVVVFAVVVSSVNPLLHENSWFERSDSRRTVQFWRCVLYCSQNMVCLFIEKVLCLYSGCHASSHLCLLSWLKSMTRWRGGGMTNLLLKISLRNSQPIKCLVQLPSSVKCAFINGIPWFMHEIGRLKIDLVYKDFRTPWTHWTSTVYG